MMQVTDNYSVTIAVIKDQIDGWYCRYPKLTKHIMNIRRFTESVIPSDSNNQYLREIIILVAVKYLLYTERSKMCRQGRNSETLSAALVFLSFRHHMSEMHWKKAELTLRNDSDSSEDSFSNAVTDLEYFMQYEKGFTEFKINSAFRYTRDERRVLRYSHC